MIRARINGIIHKTREKFFPEIYMADRSFSQDGEDMILKAFFEERSNHKGFFVDVGAHHPFRLSNTAFFYLKGWRGINIEPTPSLIPAFQKYRKEDINLNMGIANQSGSLTFFEFDEPAFNSFDKELSLQRGQTVAKIISQKEVPVAKLSDVLNQHLPKNQHIDFLTIDVEGLDMAVLESNDWSKYKPTYLLVESNVDFDSINSDAMYVYLKGKGYKLVARTKRTSVFELAQ